MTTIAAHIPRTTPLSWNDRVLNLKKLIWQTLLAGGVVLSEMPFLDHLEELRSRILKSLLAVGVSTAIGLAYAAELIQFLGRPAANLGILLVAIEATEIFSLYMRVAATAGICLAAPFSLWQIWRFIEPALHAHERRYAGPFIISTTLCFAGGAIFGYVIGAPWFLQLEASMASAAGIEFKPSALSYFRLLTTTVLAMGFVFEMPPVILVLSRIGIVNARFLLRNFKYAILVFSLAAAVLTPSTEIPPMLGFMAVMTGLYLVSIVVAWIFGRSRKTGASGGQA